MPIEGIPDDPELFRATSDAYGSAQQRLARILRKEGLNIPPETPEDEHNAIVAAMQNLHPSQIAFGVTTLRDGTVLVVPQLRATIASSKKKTARPLTISLPALFGALDADERVAAITAAFSECMTQLEYERGVAYEEEDGEREMRCNDLIEFYGTAYDRFMAKYGC